MSISSKCDCACTNEHFRLIDMPNTENVINCCEHNSLWEFEVVENCENCVAMQQFKYINNYKIIGINAF